MNDAKIIKRLPKDIVFIDKYNKMLCIYSFFFLKTPITKHIILTIIVSFHYLIYLCLLKKQLLLIVR